MKLGLFLATATAIAIALPAWAQAQTLRVATNGNDLTTLDPHRASASSDLNVVNWMFNGLVRIRPGQINPELIEPDLAESWTSSSDKLTWTFKLRAGVVCQNGNPLTSNDVVNSLKRAANKDTSSFAQDYAAFESIDAVDQAHVKIVLKQQVPSLLGLLVPYHGGNVICSGSTDKNPIGTGPFQFVEYVPQQLVRLRANEKYFRGSPKIKEIVVRYIQSEASRDLAFQSNELDLIAGRFEEEWVQRVAKLPETTVQVIGPGELHSVYINTAKPPLDDIRVREAIAHAIDRNAVVKFRGTSIAKPATSVIPSGYLGSIETDLPKYDPALSKKLLSEAGLSSGLTIKAIESSVPSMISTMQVVQSQLRAVGINLELVPVDHATYHSQIRQDLSQLIHYGAARFPVADTYLTQFFASSSIVGTPTGVTNFSHCAVADDEIAAARSGSDLAKQKELWGTAQRKIADAACSVPLYEQGFPWAWKNKLRFAVPIVGSLNLSPPIDETTELKN
ncbi:Extracellular solute-binding protein, family 5 [Agrobacterium tumefaciens str. Kerr 14]|uniref:Extracellular solute-binding protein, family 5 n=1 Tax=Agrobacterium tumefaciens str. Kerr 14 TaxID=1183424 RepID=A0A1S7SBI8_AGRTU|nr:ABC transporter substrate-binding protein [Agrobacterium tumefaciens]CUX65709.1 Extracellular solute-binding protein, family 5 [Agrobacterium tumefaciens str. Kerr 14]